MLSICQPTGMQQRSYCHSRQLAQRRRFVFAVCCVGLLPWIVLLSSRLELRDLRPLLNSVSHSDTSLRCPPNITCIAFATEAFSDYTYWDQVLQHVHAPPKCTAQCRLVSDPSQAHGLLFHAFDLPSRRRLRHMRLTWPSNQFWIYYSLESPVHLATSQCVRDCHFSLPFVSSVLAFAKEYVFPSYLLRSYPDTTEEAGFFNWTITYRRDSTIYAPYGRIASIESASKTDWLISTPPPVSMSEKKHLSFIVVSNCHPFNRRQEVLTQLSQHMELHTYGACGDRHLSRSVDITELSKMYYFHLSFENAFCRDYITEKFFFNGLIGHAVPVVFGGHSRQEYESVAPPNSFLYAGDFGSAAALAKQLKHLAASPVEYSAYQTWRKTHGSVASDRLNMFCQLCDKLKQAVGTRAPPLDLNNFYSSGSQCRPLDFDPFVAGKE